MPASITLTVAHLPTSTSFFLACLQPLEYVYRGRVDNTIGFGLPDAAPDFWITQSIPGVPPGPAHVAFPATSRGKVHDFFHAALKAGGKVHSEPALRDDCGYYSTAMIDFDGNSIEAVFRPDLMEANKESATGPKSVVSMTKSVAQSKAPTAIGSASKAKSVAPSKAASAAPSAAPQSTVSKAPSAAPSKAPSAAPSKAPTVAPTVAPSIAPSRAPTTAPSQAARSVAPSVAPAKSTVSKAPTAVPTSAPSEAPTRATLPRMPTAPAAPQGAGNALSDMLNEAKGTIAFAREVVNSTRAQTGPTSPAGAGDGNTGTSPDSHGPSDAIVGTLLGVAAGAALHYAFSSRRKSNEAASAPVTPPERHAGIARSETLPSWSEERAYYYYNQQPSGSQYAIEPAMSDFSRASGQSRGGQRLIEMIDNDQTLSQVAPSQFTARPRRRSSFSGVPSSAAPSQVSAARSRASGMKMLDAPPTSYRNPTVITAATGTSRRSRASSLSRAPSASTKFTEARSHRSPDEGYASATDDRRSKVSKASKTSKATTARPAPSRSASSSSKPASTVVTAVKKPSSPESVALPPSRAATQIDSSGHSTAGHSHHSKTHKTVIGRLTEKQLSKLENGGRFEKGNTDVTRSVISKVKNVDKLEVTNREVRPEDSVSQVSSASGSRRSR